MKTFVLLISMFFLALLLHGCSLANLFFDGNQKHIVVMEPRKNQIIIIDR